MEHLGAGIPSSNSPCVSRGSAGPLCQAPPDPLRQPRRRPRWLWAWGGRGPSGVVSTRRRSGARTRRPGAKGRRSLARNGTWLVPERSQRPVQRGSGWPGALGLGPWGGLSELLGALATRARREGRGAGPWAPRQACCPVGVWLFFPPPRPPSRPSLLGPWLKPPAGPPPHPPCVWVWMGCSEAAKLGCGPQPVQGDRAGERGPCEVRWPGRQAWRGEGAEGAGAGACCWRAPKERWRRPRAKGQKPTAPGIPRRSPIQVLTRPDPA